MTEQGDNDRAGGQRLSKAMMTAVARTKGELDRSSTWEKVNTAGGKETGEGEGGVSSLRLFYGITSDTGYGRHPRQGPARHVPSASTY